MVKNPKSRMMRRKKNQPLDNHCSGELPGTWNTNTSMIFSEIPKAVKELCGFNRSRQRQLAVRKSALEIHVFLPQIIGASQFRTAKIFLNIGNTTHILFEVFLILQPFEKNRETISENYFKILFTLFHKDFPFRNT